MKKKQKKLVGYIHIDYLENGWDIDLDGNALIFKDLSPDFPSKYVKVEIKKYGKNTKKLKKTS